MAHYAFLDDQNIVTQVIVGIDETDEVDYEILYGNIAGQTCKRTSYNTIHGVHTNGKEPYRGNYAGIGFTYVEEIDAFMPPSPYPSWTIDANEYRWVAPVPHPSPDNEDAYYWNEAESKWELKPAPYPGFILNPETNEWEPPTAMPDDGNEYYWDTQSLGWSLLPDSLEAAH